MQVQPIVFKNRNLIEDFHLIHKNNMLIKSLDYLDTEIKNNFFHFLSKSTLYPLNMFIVKKTKNQKDDAVSFGLFLVPKEFFKKEEQ